MLADVFENFRNMCLKIYELDPTRFLTAPGLAWQGALKKSKVKLDLLTFFKKKLGFTPCKAEEPLKAWSYKKKKHKKIKAYRLFRKNLPLKDIC